MASWGSGQFLSTIILLAVLFGDCSGKQEIPDGLLSKQEMTRVMIQVHLLEAKIGRLGLRHDSAKVVYKHFEVELLKELKIDTGDFAASFEYYATQPEMFTKIYNAVVDSLIEMESREKLRDDEEQKAKSDSLGMGAAKDSLVVVVDSLKVEKPKPETEEGKFRKLQKFKGDTARVNKMRQQ